MQAIMCLCLIEFTDADISDAMYLLHSMFHNAVRVSEWGMMQYAGLRHTIIHI